jgi:hypothetical protein
MFGKKGKLEKRLAAGELRRIEADVLATHHLSGGGGAAMLPEGPGEYRIRVRISPPGEEAFEASLSFFAEITPLAPHEGGKLPVAYDPEDHGDVIWDEQTARTASADKAAFDRDRRESMAAERRAQGLPPVDSSQGGPDPDLVARLAELQARKDRGELNDWEFRVARSEVFKEKGF